MKFQKHARVYVCVCVYKKDRSQSISTGKKEHMHWVGSRLRMHACVSRESDMGWEWHGLRVTWVYPYMGESPPVGWREVDFHIRSKELFLLLGSKLESRLLNNTQVLVYMVRSLRTPCEVEQGGTEEKAWIWGPETWIQMSPLDPSLCGLGNFPSPLYHFPHL